ncbi:MAG: NAD(P)(+) transhydrogenase (Re/Si-specific) subunit beta [Pseudomonadales bacterium]|jgi:NAD(P) transhydrogenase subunit beta|nr:NAD(P)(+) transhydrogenase (Re/Si-specific) subunit beta [Pseudomonadales bacterium]MDP6316727.1 NAD(P)(+) transhydrogenase (Re/Si-specific) subunit beta [Pseudomonadales bacterium]MDP7313487.1 NAD(P)(+) transhydrogenase (Re/Si-specific) subunit beta [Pseudomonadales bacterium]MDP7576045.1 NAD(P)(+) transhydrogenase (Re/Si-specific) subunit beta [Pseudomonadales bacterium]|tara:strand:+ start:8162 stop:9523 length:1362 start_codon:yes stop_codon:yes gene_type:complete
MDVSLIANLAYIVSAVLFVFGLKMLGSPATARRGNMLSSIGMLIAVVAGLSAEGIVAYKFIAIGMVVGAIIGASAARLVAMTSMPEMVALFNGSGGVASLLVGWGTLYNSDVSTFTAVTIVLAILIGGVTFTGSFIAWGKLSETIGSAAVVFTGQRVFNSLLLVALLGSSFMLCLDPSPESTWFWAVLALSLLLGVMAVIPIGGADMPVIISLLNSYSGIAACAAGFAINNNILIVAGSLVGASGIILTNIMCKAMNRSLANVLFSGFGALKQGKAIEGEVKPLSVEDAYYILEAASNVCFVPGYGMAVAQAQHVVKELGEILEKNGAEVSYAVHPVAGRMPGHMNVLLAEADVPYEQLVEMDEINPRIENVDVAIVIGANDVVNPSARRDADSPIFGMPIINVDLARTVFVLKRSMASGFSGVDNPLFFGENTRMLFGDAKESISGVISEFG